LTAAHRSKDAADCIRRRDSSPSKARQTDGWHIDYELLDPTRAGGGPHYVINARSGQILAKRYEE
jgi:hypothetical protein